MIINYRYIIVVGMTPPSMNSDFRLLSEKNFVSTAKTRVESHCSISVLCYFHIEI